MSWETFDFEDFFVGYATSSFLGIIKESLKLCAGVPSGVRMLQEGPFHSGKKLIEDAESCFLAGDEDGGNTLLEKAIDKFRDASSQVGGEMQLVSYFYAARCSARIGKPWLRDTYYERVGESLKTIEGNNKTIITAAGTTTGAAIGLGAMAIFALPALPFVAWGIAGAASGAGAGEWLKPDFTITPLKCKASELRKKIA